MAGKRLGSAIAVRSAALSLGKAPSVGSVEAKFDLLLTSLNREKSDSRIKFRI
jgi:hypothetical protein